MLKQDSMETQNIYEDKNGKLSLEDKLFVGDLPVGAGKTLLALKNIKEHDIKFMTPSSVKHNLLKKDAKDKD